ncbi:MAG: ABC transporter permease [Pseudomonadota bacterium]
MLVSVALIFAIWQAIVSLTGVPGFILPGPVKVLQSLFHNRALVAHHTWITLIEVILGLIIGISLGMMTAIGLSLSKTVRRFSMPMLVVSQTIPVFALAPILTLWLGYGLASKVAMATLIIYFPVTSTFFDGLQRTPKGFLDQAQVMQASTLRTLLQIRIPSALPALASGIRLAAVYAPIGAVIGEWVGASNGLGYLMLLANGRVKIDLMFAALIALCLLTVTLRYFVGLVCERMTRWSAMESLH